MVGSGSRSSPILLSDDEDERYVLNHLIHLSGPASSQEISTSYAFPMLSTSANAHPQPQAASDGITNVLVKAPSLKRKREEMTESDKPHELLNPSNLHKSKAAKKRKRRLEEAQRVLTNAAAKTRHPSGRRPADVLKSPAQSVRASSVAQVAVHDMPEAGPSGSMGEVNAGLAVSSPPLPPYTFASAHAPPFPIPLPPRPAMPLGRLPSSLPTQPKVAPPPLPPPATATNMAPNVGSLQPSQPQSTVARGPPQHSPSISQISISERSLPPLPSVSSSAAGSSTRIEVPPIPVTSALKKTQKSQTLIGPIGQRPESDPHCRRGNFGLLTCNNKRYFPQADCTLVMENIPSSHLNEQFINDWVLEVGNMPIVFLQLDSRANKALLEFGTPAEAKSAWSSPRLGQDILALPKADRKRVPVRLDRVFVYWYRPPPPSVNANVKVELEEGEVMEISPTQWAAPVRMAHLDPTSFSSSNLSVPLTKTQRKKRRQQEATAAAAAQGRGLLMNHGRTSVINTSRQLLPHSGPLNASSVTAITALPTPTSQDEDTTDMDLDSEPSSPQKLLQQSAICPRPTRNTSETPAAVSSTPALPTPNPTPPLPFKTTSSTDSSIPPISNHQMGGEASISRPDSTPIATAPLLLPTKLSRKDTDESLQALLAKKKELEAYIASSKFTLEKRGQSQKPVAAISSESGSSASESEQPAAQLEFRQAAVVVPSTVSPVVEVSHSSITSSSVGYSAGSNIATLNDLAESFISETIHTLQTPSLPPAQVSVAALSPASSTSKAELQARQKHLEEHIKRSKELMDQLARARSKAEKDVIMTVLREHTRSLESSEPAPAPALCSRPAQMVWPDCWTDGDMVLVVSDDEDYE